MGCNCKTAKNVKELKQVLESYNKEEDKKYDNKEFINKKFSLKKILLKYVFTYSLYIVLIIPVILYIFYNIFFNKSKIIIPKFHKV
jgi:uncharacterized membrane protein YukC